MKRTKIKKLVALLLALALCVSLLPMAVLAADAAESSLVLTEDWRLTGELDLKIPEGTTLTIDGGNAYYIYEFNGALKNTGAGLVVLKNTILYPAGGIPVPGSIAALIAAATGVTSITAPAPAQNATRLALPEVSGYTVSIKSSSNEGVIGLDCTVTPPASATTVNLVLTLTGNGGMADTSAIPVNVPAKPLSITTAALPAATVGTAYSQTIAKNYTGGGTVTFSAIGLPEGLSIDAGTGVISGTPASGANAHSPYNVAVTVSDTIITDTRTYSLTVSAAYTGGGGGNNGGSGTPSTPAPAYTANVSGSGTASTLPVTVDTASNTATVGVDAQQGNIFNGTKTASITIPPISGVTSYTLGISADNLSKAGGKGLLTFNTNTGSVSIPENMLAGTKGNKAGITIGKSDPSGLPGSIKAAIGSRPLIQLTLTVDGKQTLWSNPDAPVTVSIPYTPTAAELANPESIVIWYIDGSGNATSVSNGKYDPVAGIVTFTTTHFSNYAVVYNRVDFNDVASGEWYSKAVGFIAARGITGGAGGGNYNPNARLTRGDFLVLLMKSYDIAADTNPSDNFSDAGNTYYTGYLAAAKRLGISSGVGNNMYAPAREISRQEMFTLLYNVLKAIHQLPEGHSGKALSDFTDARQIEPWAKDAMALLVETGTIGGNAGKLAPAGTTTRAEMAQVLYNLLSK